MKPNNEYPIETIRMHNIARYIADEHIKYENEKHCTSACQYAHKIKCVCGCGGVNHGIKSMIKMDAFFEQKKEEMTLEEKQRADSHFGFARGEQEALKEYADEEEEYNKGIKESSDYFFKEFARLYYEK